MVTEHLAVDHPDSLAGVLESAAPEEEIRRTCKLFMRPGDTRELRVPKAGRQRVLSGYFDNSEKLAAAALELDGQYPAIYLTLNPCRPELLARGSNRVIPYADATTKDHEIVERRWLLIDIDPKRSTGISATDGEHGRAIAIACGIWDGLRGEGWPNPVVADSGNGTHLLYQVAMPNSDDVTQRIQCKLKDIAERYATDTTDVDVLVYNASRITKIYGTLVRKGDSTVARPHRRSRLLEIPPVIEELKPEVLA